MPVLTSIQTTSVFYLMLSLRVYRARAIDAGISAVGYSVNKLVRLGFFCVTNLDVLYMSGKLFAATNTTQSSSLPLVYEGVKRVQFVCASI